MQFRLRTLVIVAPLAVALARLAVVLLYPRWETGLAVALALAVCLGVAILSIAPLCAGGYVAFRLARVCRASDGVESLLVLAGAVCGGVLTAATLTLWTKWFS